jgi:hypothetical protein
MESETQESRTERATIPMTPHEKHALRFLAGHRKAAEAEILRAMLIGDVAAEYDRLMAKLEEVV